MPREQQVDVEDDDEEDEDQLSMASVEDDTPAATWEMQLERGVDVGRPPRPSTFTVLRARARTAKKRTDYRKGPGRRPTVTQMSDDPAL